MIDQKYHTDFLGSSNVMLRLQKKKINRIRKLTPAVQ